MSKHLNYMVVSMMSAAATVVFVTGEGKVGGVVAGILFGFVSAEFIEAWTLAKFERRGYVMRFTKVDDDG